MKKPISKFIILILVCTLMMVTVSCKSASSSNTAASKVSSYTVTDSRGKTIKFDKVPTKVISLLASDTEIVYALGAGGNLIADDTYSDCPESAAKIKKLGSGDKTNIEAIVGMKPDLVIIGTMSQTTDQYKQLENAGINVLVTRASDISDTYKVIDMIGKALNKQSKSDEIVKSMKASFDEVKAESKGHAQKTVYIEVSPLQYGLWAAGNNTFEDELLTLVNAKNVFSDVNSWAQVSEEKVLSRNPQYILTITATMEGQESPVAEIEGRKNWGSLTAVKDKHVYTIDSEAFERPGPRLADAAKQLSKLLYGE